MDRFDTMSLFLAVVEAGSLSAGGRRLNMPLASVSRKIAALEAHLKTRLFHRSSRKLTLTEAGEAYVTACRRILDEVEDAERAAAGEYAAPRGELTITAPIVFGRLHVLPVVIDFLRAYPEVDVRLLQSDRNASLLDEHIDLALRIGILPDSTMAASRVGTVRRIVCASPAYLAEHGTPASPADLAGHRCITSSIMGAPDAWLFGSGDAEIWIPVRSRLFVSTAEAAIDAAVANAGLARLLSYQVAAAVGDGALAVVLQDFEPAPYPVNLVHMGGRRVPLKLRAFLEFAAPRLRARLA